MGFSSTEELKDNVKALPLSLWGDPEPCPKFALLFLGFSPHPSHLDSASLPFPDQQLFKLPFGTQGRSWGLNENYFLKRKQETQKVFCTEEPHNVLFGFISWSQPYMLLHLTDFNLCPLAVIKNNREFNSFH